MLANSKNLQEGFNQVQAKTLSSFPKELQNMILLTHLTVLLFNEFQACYDNGKISKDKPSTSLMINSFCELIKVSGNVVFLTQSGLYRSAKAEIRYMLESAIQSFYIDTYHPTSNMITKWEILKEVENKREYRAANLIESLKIGKSKNDLQLEYKALSKGIHASHQSSINIFQEVTADGQIPADVKQEEILAVSASLTKLLDIFFFLFANYFPECARALANNKDAQKTLKTYNLVLIQQLLNGKGNDGISNFNGV
jgi:hypothetical protein